MSGKGSVKTIIFGGTFDPIHYGHLRLAEKALAETSAERLVFMPARISPFKLDRTAPSPSHRYAMIKLAIEGKKGFAVSRYEIDRDEVSYTYDTLSHMSAEYGEGISFLMGYDSLIDVETWYRGEEILKKFPLIAGARPGSPDVRAMESVKRYEKIYGADITILEIESFRASSTEIRKAVSEGKDISALVPPAVKGYILENGLYR